MEHGHLQTMMSQMFGGIFAQEAKNSRKEDFYELNQPLR